MDFHTAYRDQGFMGPDHCSHNGLLGRVKLQEGGSRDPGVLHSPRGLLCLLALLAFARPRGREPQHAHELRLVERLLSLQDA